MSKKIETPTLETERLLLKPCRLEDSKILQGYFNNWNVIKHINGTVPWPYPENGSEEHYLNVLKPKIDAGKTMVWSIFEKTGAVHLKTIEELWRDKIRRVEIWELTAENWKKFRS